VLGRTVRLLSQLTHQVALVQYPSLSRSRIRHVELVRLASSRVMTVLITDTGRVEQRLLDVSAELDQAFLGDLGTRLNATLGGLGLAEAAEKLALFPEQFPPDQATAVGRIASALIEQVLANRQDRLVMAGTANLVRTEEDFSGSIYPVLEAIEEQVTLLRLFGEMEPDHNGFSVSIGKENESFGLGETSVLTTGYASSGGEVSRLGVIGPTRMDYSNNIAAVRAVARYLSRLLGED
jgi:heat-inducible transcriptional repressor